MSTNIQSLTFVTGNVHKFNEVKAMMPYINVIRSDMDLTEIQDEPEEIVKHKCALAAHKLNGPVLVEDTGLEFTALNGLPGPYIKFFVKKIGSQGIYDLLEKHEDKSARAVCYLAFTEGPGKVIHVFKGVSEGIVVPPSGDTQFGWDDIFVPNGYNGKTFSEMGDEKNEVSHRRKSINMFSQFLVGQLIKGLRN